MICRELSSTFGTIKYNVKNITVSEPIMVTETDVQLKFSLPNLPSRMQLNANKWLANQESLNTFLKEMNTNPKMGVAKKSVWRWVNTVLLMKWFCTITMVIPVNSSCSRLSLVIPADQCHLSNNLFLALTAQLLCHLSQSPSVASSLSSSIQIRAGTEYASWGHGLIASMKLSPWRSYEGSLQKDIFSLRFMRLLVQLNWDTIAC